LDLPTLEGLGIIFVVFSNVFEELGASSLLQETHERRSEGFLLRGGDFVDFSTLHDEATIDCLEFQVSSDVGLEQNADQQTWREERKGEGDVREARLVGERETQLTKKKERKKKEIQKRESERKSQKRKREGGEKKKQSTTRHDKLGNQVHIVISGCSKSRRGLRARGFGFLKELSRVKRWRKVENARCAKRESGRKTTKKKKEKARRDGL
jgi:hypothetical protein